jgi:hypothetical protein
MTARAHDYEKLRAEIRAIVDEVIGPAPTRLT